MKIKKDDTIKIIAGKDKGKTGKVSHVLPKLNKIVSDGINVRKKHSRPKKQGEKGQTILIPAPFHASNAMVMCSGCNKPVRVSKKTVGNKKVRVCKKCGIEL